MQRRTHVVALCTVALVASSLGLTQNAGSASTDVGSSLPSADRAAPAAPRATMQVGFTDTTAIGGLSEPVSVAFAGDGTAFIALKTGAIKSFDYDAKKDTFEPAATSTDFADLSAAVNNYGDRGMTGIAVDPQFPARPFVYVNYTYNRDPNDNPPIVPKWGVPGQQYDDCPAEASLTPPVVTGCTVMDRVSRLTAQRTALGWTMVPNSELPLVTDGCAQFSSHSSGDVAFGPDGLLYASAGDGASFRGQDFGQANNPCNDPVNEGGSLRAQDQRHDGGPTDPLGIDGTIFRLHPDIPLTPTQATAGSWLVAMGQRNPWRLTFRQGKEQLWSVDVGSSNWEEINYLLDAPTTGLVNRGWPCYEGTTGASLRNSAWDALDKPICEELYLEGTGAVAAPFFSYRTRTGATPLTPGENCPVVSSSMSGLAFSQVGSRWPKAYQDVLFFSDFLRGCIWRLEKGPDGQPDPSSIRVFAQAAGSPVDLTTGPGGDLYYVDYGIVNGDVAPGAGGIHRIKYTGSASLTLKSSPKKVKIKVNGHRQQAPYRTELAKGTKLKLKARKVVKIKGVRYVFVKWVGKGIGRDQARLKQKLKVRTRPVTLKAIYRRIGR